MAQLKNTTISDTGSLNLPVGTTAQRPGSPNAGMIRYNTTINDTEYYDGTAWRPISDSNPEATGGTVVDTDIGGVPYRIHIFKDVGNSTFTVTRDGAVEYLIVAGGGGGGGSPHGAGGGAGGLLTGTTTVTPQSYTITVGAGGAGKQGNFTSPWPPAGTNRGTQGGNSSVFGLTAIGGGGGGGYSGGGSSDTVGGNGGSGGGTGRDPSAVGQGTAGQGNNGGRGGYSFIGGSGYNTAGGGGGAGGRGYLRDAMVTSRQGHGGPGISSNISGNTVFYAGGGGGSSYGANAGEENPPGGIGGGGIGDDDNSAGIVLTAAQRQGVPGTGGGGGGAERDSTGDARGGDGGSGIVVIRYPRNSSTTTAPDETRPSYQPYFYARDVRPIIVRDGLVLDLDAANPLSYPGTGTTWTDLSGNGNDAVISLGSPDFVTNFNGSFKFSLGSEDRFAVSASNDFDISSGNFTIELWLRMSTAGDSTNTYYGILAVGDTEGGLESTYIRQWRSGIYPGSIFSRINGTIGLGYDSSIDVNISGEGWYQIIMRENNGTWQYLFNGNIIESVATPSYPTSGAKWITLGKDTSLQSFDGEIGALRFYQRSLSDVEIQQNFNALRGRYGI